MRIAAALLGVLVFTGCASAPVVPDDRAAAEVTRVLDDFHDAAARADEPRYFAHFSPTGVFLGTDGGERWTVEAFRAYAHPHFAAGRGWTFTPEARNVSISSDGRVAWFDEALRSASYGECRGTGVLQKVGGEWKVEQYNLTIPIPNALADELVKRIRDSAKTGP